MPFFSISLHKLFTKDNATHIFQISHLYKSANVLSVLHHILENKFISISLILTILNVVARDIYVYRLSNKTKMPFLYVLS